MAAEEKRPGSPEWFSGDAVNIRETVEMADGRTLVFDPAPPAKIRPMWKWVDPPGVIVRAKEPHVAPLRERYRVAVARIEAAAGVRVADGARADLLEKAWGAWQAEPVGRFIDVARGVLGADAVEGIANVVGEEPTGGNGAPAGRGKRG